MKEILYQIHKRLRKPKADTSNTGDYVRVHAGECVSTHKQFKIYLTYPEKALGEKHTLKHILCQDLSYLSRGSKTKLAHFKVSGGK